MYCTPSSCAKDKSWSGFQKYFLSCLVFGMPQWQSCLIGFLWGHSRSDWLPVSVLGYTEFVLAPKWEVGPDSHYAPLWCASKGYNAGSFWLGRVHLGLAPHSLVFPSVLNFNEWQLHEQCSSVATVKMILEQMKKSTEELWFRDEEKHLIMPK